MEITHFQNIGKRDYQEDRFVILPKFAGVKHLTLCVVADGHGGEKAACFLIQEYPRQLLIIFMEQKKKPPKLREKFLVMLGKALEQCIEIWERKCLGDDYGMIKNDTQKKAFFASRDEKLWEKYGLESGSTCVAALLDLHKRRIHVINIGDSRATWIVDDAVIGQTVDHAVKKRMEPIKGFKFTNTEGRLQGDLAMSHSFGDMTEELYGVVSRKYDAQTVDFKGKSLRLCLASDGLFDVSSNHKILYEPFKDASEVAASALQTMHEAEMTVRAQVAEAGGVVEKKTFVPVFEDNVTIIYVKIPKENLDIIQEEEEETAVQEKQVEETPAVLTKKLNTLIQQCSTLVSNLELEKKTLKKPGSRKKTTTTTGAKKGSVKRAPKKEVYRQVKTGTGMTLNFTRKKSRER